MLVSGITRLFCITAICVAATAMTALPAAADDRSVCGDTGAPLESKLTACNRVISGGRYKGKELAFLYTQRAEVYRLKKDWDTAEADFEIAVKINPGDNYVYLNRAELYRESGKTDLAISEATRSINIDPTFPAAYTIRGLAYQKLGDLAKARENFNKALSMPKKGSDGEWAQKSARAQLDAMK